jgi:uncharacterized protein (DUF488 family)
MDSPELSVFTIGHSNRGFDEFARMLTAYGVQLLVDVRTVPRSRHNPQYNRETLPATLEAEGIGYLHMPGLGGLRHARRDSPNTGWRNLSFRGYADYMQTKEFEQSIREFLSAIEGRRAALMCAESVPWRCHRSPIADALTARGIPVGHIMSATRVDRHTVTPFAKVYGLAITYPSLLEEN